MGKARILGVVGVLGTTAVIAAGGSPAQAHYNSVHHGDDWATINTAHDYLKACDQEADGHGVRAHWRTITGDIGVTGWDPDGANGPYCGWGVPPSSAIEFRVCENDVGCSAWEYM